MRVAPAIVFDLDGTISDPADGIGRSLNHALAAFGYHPVAETDVSQYVGPPLDESFAAITGSRSSTHIADLVAKYRERYADAGYAENTLYPGIPGALAQLSDRGHPLGVCTSKRIDFAERILELFGLSKYFAFVSGGDVGIRKVEQLRTLLGARTIDQDSIMVGDRAVDVHAAKHNGLRSIGVLWGHGSIAELSEAGPTWLLEAVPELLLLDMTYAG